MYTVANIKITSQFALYWLHGTCTVKIKQLIFKYIFC